MIENQNVSTEQKQMLFNALTSIDTINKEIFSKIVKLIWDVKEKTFLKYPLFPIIFGKVSVPIHTMYNYTTSFFFLHFFLQVS